MELPVPQWKIPFDHVSLPEWSQNGPPKRDLRLKRPAVTFFKNNVVSRVRAAPRESQHLDSTLRFQILSVLSLRTECCTEVS